LTNNNIYAIINIILYNKIRLIKGGIKMVLQVTILKSCPFCSEKAEVYYGEFSDDYTVYCTQCHCSMQNVANTLDKAVEAWNTRDGKVDK